MNCSLKKILIFLWCIPFWLICWPRFFLILMIYYLVPLSEMPSVILKVYVAMKTWIFIYECLFFDSRIIFTRMFRVLLFLYNLINFSVLFTVTVVTLEHCKHDGSDDCYIFFHGDPGAVVMALVDIKIKAENVSSVVVLL